MKTLALSSWISVLLLNSISIAAEPDSAEVSGATIFHSPGAVIFHSPASSKVYIGSPGIVGLGEGVYLSKYDEFGPGTTEHENAVTCVYRSEDQGKTWNRVARIDGLFWANLFIHKESVYLLGTTRHHGQIVILRSDDAGDTWTSPSGPNQGMITSDGEYHTAPMPMVKHDGRLWRTVEDAMGGKRWGKRYRARMLSIPVDANLLVADNWTLSSPLAQNPEWLDGEFKGWLEGNAVLSPDGKIVNILRVASSDGGKAAIVKVDEKGETLSFDPDTGFIDFPGGSKKFTIRFDPKTQSYWTLSNPVLPRHVGEKKAASIRNTLALMCSKDLRNWEIRCILIYDARVPNHGFQYPDWLFDGDDMVAVVRTASEDGHGGAHNAHDANFLTFHRFADFRDLTMEDSVTEFKTRELRSNE